MKRTAILSVLILLSLLCLTSAQADTINGCVGANGSLRVVLPGESCKNSEFAISWNSVGLQGPAGPQGAQGGTGPAGPQGPAGDACSHPVLIGLMQINDGSTVGPQIPIYGATGGVVDAIGGGGGGGAGKAVFSPFAVQKALDATSPDLIKDAASGKNLKTITITINATQTSPAAIIELSDGLISSYSVVPTCGVMLESVQLDFGKIRITVNGVTACWDLVQNKSC
jgi:Type VI secretion system effector, Hcp